MLFQNERNFKKRLKYSNISMEGLGSMRICLTFVLQIKSHKELVF